MCLEHSEQAELEERSERPAKVRAGPPPRSWEVSDFYPEHGGSHEGIFKQQNEVI